MESQGKKAGWCSKGLETGNDSDRKKTSKICFEGVQGSAGILGNVAGHEKKAWQAMLAWSKTAFQSELCYDMS